MWWNVPEFGILNLLSNYVNPPLWLNEADTMEGHSSWVCLHRVLVTVAVTKLIILYSWVKSINMLLNILLRFLFRIFYLAHKSLLFFFLLLSLSRFMLKFYSHHKKMWRALPIISCSSEDLYVLGFLQFHYSAFVVY